MLGYSYYYAMALEAKEKRPEYMFSANKLAEFLFERSWSGDVKELLEALDKKYKGKV